MNLDPSTWGLTPAGFYRPTLAEIIETGWRHFERELKAQGIEDWQQSRDPTNPATPYIVSTASLTDISWAAQERIWQQMTPQSAVGMALDAIGGVVQVPRIGQARSLGRLTLTGRAGTVIPKGTRFIGPTGDLFALDAATTLGSGGTVEALTTCVEFGNSNRSAQPVLPLSLEIRHLRSCGNGAAVRRRRPCESVVQSGWSWWSSGQTRARVRLDLLSDIR